MHSTVLYAFSTLSYLAAALFTFALFVSLASSGDNSQALRGTFVLISLSPIAGGLFTGALLGAAGKALDELVRIREAVEDPIEAALERDPPQGDA